MSVYVKLGYEWKLTHEGEFFYLSNMLRQQLYKIDPFLNLCHQITP